MKVERLEKELERERTEFQEQSQQDRQAISTLHARTRTLEEEKAKLKMDNTALGKEKASKSQPLSSNHLHNKNSSNDQPLMTTDATKRIEQLEGITTEWKNVAYRREAQVEELYQEKERIKAEPDKAMRMNFDAEKELVELMQRVKDQHAEIESLKEGKATADKELRNLKVNRTIADEELRKWKEQNSQLEGAVKPLVNALVPQKNPARPASLLD